MMTPMFTGNNTHLNLDSPELRDVTSTARLFNFRRPVYMVSEVWDDCVELMAAEDGRYDELAVLQRLRHVLFMAASALHGRVEDLQYEFRVYRVANGALHGQRQPEPVTLHLSAHKDEHNRPVITISFPIE
ncbi:hypothetical protein MNBD_GAMMA09-2046 [hydrothermal vent metagenome]|uniref:Uncharacterized protein n=1 Tax=hydrothermal vent metagenome TaxID=652676 RepID=A0A3B0YIE8_9ZZZZ